MCKAQGVLLAVDNTFMTPYFQRPLELGADIVAHSMTKYLNGHSDVVGGALIVQATTRCAIASPSCRTRSARVPSADGLLPGAARHRRRCTCAWTATQQNARALAERLGAIRRSRRSTIRGSQSHPQHALAKRQMSGFGGMISFVPRRADSSRRASVPVGACELFTLRRVARRRRVADRAPGDHDARVACPRKPAQKLGIVDGFIRLSVGIEDLVDLGSDLEAAFAAARL